MVHSGGLYTGCQLVTQVLSMIRYLYTLFTLWQMHVHTCILIIIATNNILLPLTKKIRTK